MIIVLKPNTPQEEIDAFQRLFEQQGLGTHLSKGVNTTILGLVGDTSSMNEKTIAANHLVDHVVRVQEPYKMANRKFHPEDTVIAVASKAAAKDNHNNGFAFFGKSHFSVIAGPCSVEGEDQLVGIARAVKASGATFLRGGAFKPRTSPYSFQGLGKEGIHLLELAKKATGLPIVTEVMAIKQLEVMQNVDVIQIGARNMQNFDLLKEVGKCGKPVLLKRGLSATIKEFLMSAEYIMSEGNDNVILCERGIRTFDNYTRNCLDLSAVPYLKKVSHLPVVIDPSHACGISWMVEPLSKAAIAAGADGLMIEVHNNPEKALSDGEQSLTPKQFDSLMQKLEGYIKLEERSL
ncbi:MAG: 3-deoxy-7-phosphoheptulonate synthase [Treponema sp. CETP13]|nr:MAG: 3-deoxy-7-phosphoheptulonate synthase [Treponema sp. CETP13]